MRKIPFHIGVKKWISLITRGKFALYGMAYFVQAQGTPQSNDLGGEGFFFL